jgi:hypothetical protein
MHKNTYTHLAFAWTEMLFNADRFETLGARHQFGAVQFVENAVCCWIPLINHTACNKQLV